MTNMALSLIQGGRFAFIAAGAALLISLGGCGGGETDPVGIERNIQAPHAPADAALIQRVNAAWQYAVGGDTNPTTIFPCTGASKDIEGLSTLRAALAASLITSHGTCTAESQGTSAIGGETVGVYKVSCEGLSAETARLIWNIPRRIEACWSGAGARWRIGDWKLSPDIDAPRGEAGFDLEMAIDPEPALLIGDLHGSGSPVVASYVDSGSFAWAYYWPSTWTPGSLPAGVPCANYPASVGTVLTTTIQAAGSYRVCR